MATRSSRDRRRIVKSKYEMLMNFCDPSLRTEVECGTVSTEGYEVENLVNKSDKGFMAYSCIKPPVHVDFHFLCNIRINHVIIWPNVGAQKSSGFQMFAKCSDETDLHTIISTGYLKSSNPGIIFHRSDIDPATISNPSNFLLCRMKSRPSKIISYAIKLRISVIKTENSVPALGKVEIWGAVSPQCGKDVIANISSLWSQRNICQSIPVVKKPILLDQSYEKKIAEFESLVIPEDFLDPITCEIMTQPIVLPCGKVIDQSTLEKHEQNESIWGRLPSDPFTGIVFSKTSRPLAATALKAQIDKFLLENCNSEEVKKLPRVLGTKCRPESSLGLLNVQGSGPSSTVNQTAIKPKILPDILFPVKRKSYCHMLPIAPIKRNCNIIINKSSVKKKAISEISQESCSLNSRKDEKKLSCDCCTNSIFYKMPCKHIVCRNVLLLNRRKCAVCQVSCETDEPERIHV